MSLRSRRSRGFLLTQNGPRSARIVPLPLLFHQVGTQRQRLLLKRRTKGTLMYSVSSTETENSEQELASNTFVCSVRRRKIGNKAAAVLLRARRRRVAFPDEEPRCVRVFCILSRREPVWLLSRGNSSGFLPRARRREARLVNGASLKRP